jgi:hypothetical protein
VHSKHNNLVTRTLHFLCSIEVAFWAILPMAQLSTIWASKLASKQFLCFFFIFATFHLSASTFKAALHSIFFFADPQVF